MTKQDHIALESFGGREISLARATRFHWSENKDGDPVFQLYKGGPNEYLSLYIERDRKNDVFIAMSGKDEELAQGSLDHVMAVIDKALAIQHGEDTPS